MNNEIDTTKISKDILIEDRAWKRVKTKVLESRLRQNNSKFDSGDIISELLTKYDRKEINFEPLTLEKRSKKKIKLTKEASEVYRNLPAGTKTYVVNGLLRRWVK